MHFQGKLLVSRATAISSRSLLSASIVKILIVWADVNTASFAVLGIEFGKIDLNLTSNFLIGFLLINHVLSWWGDKLSFQNWNTSEKARTQGGIAPLDASLISKLDSALEITEMLRAKVDKEFGGSGSSSMNSMIKDTKSSGEALSAIRVGVEQLDLFARLYFYGWFLFVPVFAAIVALFQKLPFALNVSG